MVFFFQSTFGLLPLRATKWLNVLQKRPQGVKHSTTYQPCSLQCALSSCPLPAKWISSHSRHSWLTSLCENLSGIISQLLKDRWFCTTKIATSSSTTFSLKPTALATIKTLPFFFLGLIWAYWFKSGWKIINHVFILSIWNWPWSGSSLCTNPSKPVWPFWFLVSIW